MMTRPAIAPPERVGIAVTTPPLPVMLVTEVTVGTDSTANPVEAATASLNAARVVGSANMSGIDLTATPVDVYWTTVKSITTEPAFTPLTKHGKPKIFSATCSKDARTLGDCHCVSVPLTAT
jgi:hypothetical protein